jgi:hypothetical protein
VAKKITVKKLTGKDREDVENFLSLLKTYGVSLVRHRRQSYGLRGFIDLSDDDKWYNDIHEIVTAYDRKTMTLLHFDFSAETYEAASQFDCIFVPFLESSGFLVVKGEWRLDMLNDIEGLAND